MWEKISKKTGKEEEEIKRRTRKEKSISSYCLFLMFDKDTWRQCEDARWIYATQLIIKSLLRINSSFIARSGAIILSGNGNFKHWIWRKDFCPIGWHLQRGSEEIFHFGKDNSVRPLSYYRINGEKRKGFFSPSFKFRENAGAYSTMYRVRTEIRRGRGGGVNRSFVPGIRAEKDFKNDLDRRLVQIKI